MAYIPPSNYPVQYMPPNPENVPMQVVTQVPQRQVVYTDVPMPRDHIVWSLFNFMYCNPLCFGLVAFIYSIKARDRKMAGDYVGARSYASTARCLNIAALVVAVLITVLVFSQIYTIINAFQNLARKHGRG